MSAFQGQIRVTNVYLQESGSPVTGVPYSAVAVQYLQAGATVFATKVVTSANWLEVGSGWYTLTWATTDMANVGPFLYLLTATGAQNVTGQFDINPTPIAFLANPALCIVSGNVSTLGGMPAQTNILKFHISAVPKSVNGYIISSDLVETTPDAFGNFSVALIRGATVVVEISQPGLRQQFTVPNQPTATLLSLLPPF